MRMCSGSPVGLEGHKEIIFEEGECPLCKKLSFIVHLKEQIREYVLEIKDLNDRNID